MATRDRLSATIYTGVNSAGDEKMRATITFSDGTIKRPDLIPWGMSLEDVESIAHNLHLAAKMKEDVVITEKSTGCDTDDEFTQLVALWYPIGLFEQKQGQEVRLVLSRAGKLVVGMIDNQEYTQLKQ